MREGYESLMRRSLAEGGEAAVSRNSSDVGIKVGSVITDWERIRTSRFETGGVECRGKIGENDVSGWRPETRAK